MARSHWLVKADPDTYGWTELTKEKRTRWSGVRNHTARNNLAAMQQGDLVLFYHSGAGKEVVGVAKVTATAVPDPTAKPEEGWVAPELAVVKALATPVTLAAIKADAKLKDIALVKMSRLSVMPIPAAAFERILGMGKTRVG